MTHVIAFVSGGVLQGVVCDQNVELLVVDEDCEGFANVPTMRDTDGDDFEALVSGVSTPGNPLAALYWFVEAQRVCAIEQ